jgi:hypothetical protein
VKRGTPDHFKVHALGQRIGLPRYAVVGVLELLWHMTAKYAKAGDIGRLKDEEIAFYLGYDRDAKALIDALVESHWLDLHEEHRLLVHDWPDHCEDSVHMALARNGERFADGRTPKLGRLTMPEKQAAMQAYSIQSSAQPSSESCSDAGSPRAHTKRTGAHMCALPKPSPKPLPLPEPLPKKEPPTVPVVPPDPLNTPVFLSAWNDYEAHRREMKQKPLTDRSRIAKLQEMAAWGHDAAIESIRNTIASGWKGLFQPPARSSSHEPSSSRNSAQQRAQRRAAEVPEPPAPLPVFNPE